MKRIRGGKRMRRQVRVGAPDRGLTPNAGMAVISELCGRLGVIGAVDAALGPVKQRARGFGAGELLTGIASAQLAGEDFLVGLDRQRADAAGQQITPVPGLSSTTAAGLARRITPGQWRAEETGLAAVTGRMLSLLPAPRAAALAEGRSPLAWAPPTWRSTAARSAGGLITTRGSGWAARTWPPGPRPRSLWPPTWVSALMTRARPPDLLRRALAALPGRARVGRVEDWREAIEMEHAQVAVADYCPEWWPAGTSLLVRRVRLDPGQVSAGPRTARQLPVLTWYYARSFSLRPIKDSLLYLATDETESSIRNIRESGLVVGCRPTAAARRLGQ